MQRDLVSQSEKHVNPQVLPDGPVLVVGGGNSGFEIAEELAPTRQVDLSIGTRVRYWVAEHLTTSLATRSHV